MGYLLGVDVGTLGTKVLLVDEMGALIGHFTREHPVYHRYPGWAEHEPLQDWWQDFITLTRQMLAETHIHAAAIEAVGIVGAFPSPCLTTKDGTPLNRAILYSDNRAEQYLYEINQKWGLQLTGDDVTPKLLWIKRNEPEILARAGMILSAHSFIIYQLTGVYSIDFANATWFGGLYDYSQRGWIYSRCSEIGIPDGIMPPIYSGDAIVGEITRSASQITGLAVGTPVVAGSGDMYLALLGTGAVNPGDAIIYYGTAGLLLYSIRPFNEVIGRSYLSSRQELALLIAYIQASGEVVRWFSQLINPDRLLTASSDSLNLYAKLDDAASRVPPGSNGVLILPYFLGERSPAYHPEAKGCIYGLSPDHTAAEIHRGILESFGFGIRHALISYPAERSSIQKVFSCGGGARSSLWRQIVSDILSVEQVYNPKASSALGAAYLAGLGISKFPNLETISQVWLRDRKETYPNPGTKSVYDRCFDHYLALYEASKNIQTG